jgi:hypothetical protein
MMRVWRVDRVTRVMDAVEVSQSWREENDERERSDYLLFM